MTEPTMGTSEAYIYEYGKMPETREERDRYQAFKFGFDHGKKLGRFLEASHFAREAKTRAEGHWPL